MTWARARAPHSIWAMVMVTPAVILNNPNRRQAVAAICFAVPAAPMLRAFPLYINSTASLNTTFHAALPLA